MKKIILIATLTAIVAGGLAGCGKSKEEIELERERLHYSEKSYNNFENRNKIDRLLHRSPKKWRYRQKKTFSQNLHGRM